MEKDDGLSLNEIAVPILALSAFTALCYFAAVVMVPMVMAITLAYVLWPAIDRLKRWKIPHIVAVLLVVILAIILLSLIGLVIYGQASEFVTGVPEYWQQFQQLRALCRRKGNRFRRHLAFFHAVVKSNPLLTNGAIRQVKRQPRQVKPGAVRVFVVTLCAMLLKQHCQSNRNRHTNQPPSACGIVSNVKRRQGGKNYKKRFQMRLLSRCEKMIFHD